MNGVQYTHCLRSLICQKNLFVLGSSPDANLSGYEKDDILCTVNGAALAFPELQPAKIWFLNSCTLLSKGSVAAIATRDNLKDLNCETMVSVEACGPSPISKYFPNLPFESRLAISRQQRCEALKLMGFSEFGEGGVSVPSMGVFALMSLAFSGAAKITASGFSFSSSGGHSYLPGVSTPNGHSKCDNAVLPWLLQKGVSFK